MSFAGREGLLHHGTGNRAVLIGNLVAHALHGDVRLLGGVSAEANDNQGELEELGLRKL